MRASHSKAKCLRLKLVARPLLTREQICIFSVVLALPLLLQGRALVSEQNQAGNAQCTPTQGSGPVTTAGKKVLQLQQEPHLRTEVQNIFTKGPMDELWK